MGFVIGNQLLFLLLSFAAGATIAILLFRMPAGHPMWRVADLVWVLVGGVGALAAVIAGLYSADSSKLGRQIDLAYAASAAFDQDAARFRLRFCEAPARDQITILCDKVEFLSASTAQNADLPLFLSLSEEIAPLQRLQLFGHSTGMEKMEELVRDFDPEPFLVFAALDTSTQQAVDSLRTDVSFVAADFLVLARSYTDLITRVGSLKSEWEYLQGKAGILLLQIFALCLVSFAAPFRLGKSLAELMASPQHAVKRA